MRLSGTKATAIHQYRGLGNQLWDLAGNRPSLDLRFADSKSLVDATTGTNLIDFTRASSGTYVGSDGLIKTATTNYLLRSEEFDQSPWAFSNAAVSPNQAVAPNGTTSADLFVPAAGTAIGGNGNFHNIRQSITLISGTVYTLSFYLKAGGYSSLRFGLSSQLNLVNNYSDITVNLNTLAVTQTLGIGSITPIGGGWYRVTATGTATSTTGFAVCIVADGGTADGTSGIYLWGAQLEQSSTVGEYVKTTSTINSAPRFDHDPTTGESLGLLVEEQRVNYCLQSEAFGTSPWSASNVTVTANTETSPASTLTADTLAATSGNGTVTQPVTTTAVDMTFSVYLKRKTGTGNIDITADGTTWVTQTINDTTWTRCIVTQTAVAGTSNPGVRIVASGDEVYAWGGQYE